MQRLLAPLWWLFGSTVLAGVALRWSVGDRIFVTRYTGYLMPWLLVGLVPGAAWAWVERRRPLAAVLVTSAAIILVVHAPLFRPRPPPPPSPGLTLKVMSFNTWSRNTDVSRIASVILRHRPDVLLLQEIRPEVFSRLSRALAGLYDGSPVHRVYDRELLQAVVSRHPVESWASLEEKGNAQKAVLRTPAGLVTVFNVHPLRHGGWRGRYSQIAALLEEDVLPEPGPVILGGDLNAPDRSQLYALLARELTSAHEERGFGFGFTYPARIGSRFGAVPAVPLVRIDHIFFSKHLVAVRAGTLADSGGSDHRPVLAEVALRSAEPSARRPTSADAGPITGPPLGAGARGRPRRAVSRRWRGILWKRSPDT